MKDNQNIDSIQELNYNELASTLGGETARALCGCICVGDLTEVPSEDMLEAKDVDPGNTNKNGRKSKRNS